MLIMRVLCASQDNKILSKQKTAQNLHEKHLYFYNPWEILNTIVEI